MRIALVADPSLPGAWYRGYGPMEALAARGHELRQLWRLGGQRLHGELIAGCDVLHVHRRFDDDTIQLARNAKQRGMAVIYDNDDDLRAVPRNNPAYRDLGGFAGERVLRGMRRLLGLADLATTPSPVIAERFGHYGASCVRVIENYVPDRVLGVSAPPHRDRVVVGWIGGLEHRIDVERLPLAGAFGRLLEAFPQLEIETIGVGLGLRHPRYRHVGRVSFDELPQQLAHYDMGLAPLADVPFNHARSSIKVKEYAALGRPWLASPLGPYVGLGEREGGRLVPDEGWFDSIAQLIDRPRERRKLARRARKWGRTQAISANADVWEQALAEARERAADAALAGV